MYLLMFNLFDSIKIYAKKFIFLFLKFYFRFARSNLDLMYILNILNKNYHDNSWRAINDETRN